jgi:mannose-6-phosphate isomerase-like protein (cupin superfamily)
MFPPLFLDIHKEAQKNKKFRSVIYESNIMRVVVMSLKKDQEIGEEIHNNEDQFIKVEKGIGMLILENDKTQEINKGQSVIIPKGTYHNFRNIGEKPLKIYSIYAKVFNPYAE